MSPSRGTYCSVVGDALRLDWPDCAMASGADEQALLKAKLADRPVLVSCEQNKKEFGLA